MLYVAKIISLIALCGSVAWFTREPDWEPWVGALTAFATFITAEYFQWKDLRRLKGANGDVELFQKFIRELPSTGAALLFLKEHDIGSSFQDCEISPIDLYLRQWETAEHVFLDIELERAHKQFLNRLKEFRFKLSDIIQPEGRGYYSIGVKDWEDREHVLAARDQLNKLATSAYEAHQEFVLLARKRLPSAVG